jgi:signal transduction histidine kinase
MMRSALLLLLSCCAVLVSAQLSTQVAEYEAALRNPALNDSLRIQHHATLSLQYEGYDVEASFQHALKAHYLALRGRDSLLIARCEYRLSYLYQYDLNDPGKAFEMKTRVLAMAQKYRDTTLILDCCYSLGMLLTEQGDDKEAFNYLHKADLLAEKRGQNDIVTMTNIEKSRLTSVQYEKQAYLNRALRFAEKTPADTIARIQAMFEMGIFYKEKMGNLIEANNWFQKVIDLAEAKKSKAEEFFVNTLYLRACYRAGKLKEAIDFCNKTLAEQAGNPNFAAWYRNDLYFTLSDCYHALGMDSLAYETLNLATNLEDSLTEVRTRQRAQTSILGLQTEMNMQQKEAEFLLLTERNRVAHRTNALLGLLLLLAISFGAYLMYNRRKIRQQNHQLEKMNATQTKLLSIISHDARSPIHALRNILSLFKDGIAHADDVKLVAHQVDASLDNLVQNLDNLMLWAQNQQDALVPAPEKLLLHEYLQQQLVVFEESLREKKIEIKADGSDSPEVTCDPAHLRSILQNVVSNAIKFSPKAATINIKSVGEGHDVILTISNTGKLLSDDDIKNIFDPAVRYTRVGTAGEPGSGLGLSLAKELMELNRHQLQLVCLPPDEVRVVLRFMVAAKS